MGVYINIDVKEIRRGAVAILNIDDVAFFVNGKDIIAVPDHGDLIDREALVALWEKDIVGNKESGITDYAYTDMEQIYREFINDAKMFRAVIPAERREKCD